MASSAMKDMEGVKKLSSFFLPIQSCLQDFYKPEKK